MKSKIHEYQNKYVAMSKKIVTTIAIVVASVIIYSFANNETTNTDKGLSTMKADHLLIGVNNFTETLQWYEDILGFEVEVQWKVDGLDNLDLAYLNNGDFRLEIIGDNSAPQTNRQASGFADHLSHQGFAHLCFQVEDIDLAMKQLNDKGIETFVKAETYPLSFYERRVAFIKDLNGNIIEFAGPLKDTRNN
ncbi:VOC family protein [Aquimarina sp. U1-2]|uniref:VOC family protein n=1 Tax=Aquimarina sp. U1-2 TaxID=2823141 RepID=UPI001AECD6F3|nr:VOC family protein [Aquimarina sp. U1-2]MBP2831046.1 VOC family protein [Aquimarina sp. U1-2]